MDRDYLIELFADFGPSCIRRMFSGYGISADGINFAHGAARGGLSSAPMRDTIPHFEAEGSQSRFSIRPANKTVTVKSYWQSAGAAVRRSGGRLAGRGRSEAAGSGEARRPPKSGQENSGEEQRKRRRPSTKSASA